jgi:hypothetical protein
VWLDLSLILAVVLGEVGGLRQDTGLLQSLVDELARKDDREGLEDEQTLDELQSMESGADVDDDADGGSHTKPKRSPYKRE